MPTYVTRILALCLLLCLLLAAFLAQGVVKWEPATGTVYDGFGRLLTKTPAWAIVVRADQWAGLGWRIFDMVWFWGGLYLAFRLFVREKR
jgi:hypothetical protein